MKILLEQPTRADLHIESYFLSHELARSNLWLTKTGNNARKEIVIRSKRTVEEALRDVPPRRSCFSLERLRVVYIAGPSKNR